MCLLFFPVPAVHAAAPFADALTVFPAEQDARSPKKKLLSYATVAKVEALFVQSLVLQGRLNEDGKTTLPVNYQFTLDDRDEEEYGTRSYEIDIAIDDAVFKNLTLSIDPDFILREETAEEYIYTRKSLICADRIVLRGNVDAEKYEFVRNDVPVPEDDDETDYFDTCSFHASGHSDAELTIKGTTCVPIDINIKIDKATGLETYEHEIIPLYREDEACAGEPESELLDPVFTEAEFEGIDIPIYLIPAEYAASVIEGLLDDLLEDELLPAIAQEVFVLDLPPGLDRLLQNRR